MTITHNGNGGLSLFINNELIETKANVTNAGIFNFQNFLNFPSF
jgi:hypothetical protein